LLNILATKDRGESVWYYDSKKESDYKRCKYPTIEGLEIKPDKRDKLLLNFKHIIKSVIWYIAPAVAAVATFGMGIYIFQAKSSEAYIAAIGALFGFRRQVRV